MDLESEINDDDDYYYYYCIIVYHHHSKSLHLTQRKLKAWYIQNTSTYKSSANLLLQKNLSMSQ